jgi:Flp pilus assembly protein TadG
MEFILSIFTMMFVIFWIFELVMAVYTKNVLADAAKEGVRYAIVHGKGNGNCSGPNTPVCPDPTGANVIAQVQNFAQMTLHDTSAMTVTVQYLDNAGGSATTVDPNTRVRVEASYTYVPYIVLPWVTPTLNSAAEGRIVN